MAFPYIFESNFEQGTNGEWDSETDTGSKLNFRHYTYLAREDVAAVGPIAPWRGAYVAEWDLGDTNDHILIEGDIDIADQATRWTRFYLFLGKDLRGVTDVFNIYEHQGTANAIECAISLKITTGADLVEIGLGQTSEAGSFSTKKLRKGQWYCLDLKTFIDTGTAGTSDLYVDGGLVASLTGLTNTAVARGVLGTQNTLSTTLGHIYMDRFAHDDTQLGPDRDRYPETIMISKSMHICLGESELLNVTLLPGAATDNTLTIYDTDKAETTVDNNVVALLYNLTSSEPPIDLADVPVRVKRGAYVALGGTNPRALVHIGRSQGYNSHGRVRQHGYSRSVQTNATQ